MYVYVDTRGKKNIRSPFPKVIHNNWHSHLFLFCHYEFSTQSSQKQSTNDTWPSCSRIPSFVFTASDCIVWYGRHPINDTDNATLQPYVNHYHHHQQQQQQKQSFSFFFTPRPPSFPSLSPTLTSSLSV